MARITDKDLGDMVGVVNELLETEDKDYEFKLDKAYGGNKLVRVPGYCDVLNCGFVSKPLLYELMNAFIEGIRMVKGENI
jgi:hypothetical protein